MTLAACGGTSAGSPGGGGSGSGGGGEGGCSPYLESEPGTECVSGCWVALMSSGVESRYCTTECGPEGECPADHVCAGPVAKSCQLECTGACPAGMSCKEGTCRPGEP